MEKRIGWRKIKVIKKRLLFDLAVFEVHAVTKDYCNKDKSYGNNA